MDVVLKIDFWCEIHAHKNIHTHLYAVYMYECMYVQLLRTKSSRRQNKQKSDQTFSLSRTEWVKVLFSEVD